jgi:hypothetical protein
MRLLLDVVSLGAASWHTTREDVADLLYEAVNIVRHTLPKHQSSVSIDISGLNPQGRNVPSSMHSAALTQL